MNEPADSLSEQYESDLRSMVRFIVGKDEPINRRVRQNGTGFNIDVNRGSGANSISPVVPFKRGLSRYFDGAFGAVQS